MDEMRINSKFMKKVIASGAEKFIKNKFGVVSTIQLNDNVTITMDDEDAYMHLNVDLMCKSADLERFLSQI